MRNCSGFGGVVQRKGDLVKSGISVSRKKWFAVCLCREEIGIAVLDCEIACEIEQMVLWCRGLRDRGFRVRIDCV